LEGIEMQELWEKHTENLTGDIILFLNGIDHLLKNLVLDSRLNDFKTQKLSEISSIKMYEGTINDYIFEFHFEKDGLETIFKMGKTTENHFIINKQKEYVSNYLDVKKLEERYINIFWDFILKSNKIIAALPNFNFNDYVNR
jgi:hypothetical protein